MDASLTIAHPIGSIAMHYTFNGAAPIGRGWMVCDGNVVNQTNYDATHGAGAYVADGIANSPIAAKYLPNMVNKYAVGVSSTTATGASTIPSVGNTSHQVNLSHNHQWYISPNGSTNDASYDSSGTPTEIGFSSGNHTGLGYTFSGGTTYQSVNANQYTVKTLSTAQSVQPESIQVLYIIKVGM